MGVGFKLETTVTRTWATPVKFTGATLGVLAVAATVYTLYSDYQNNNGWDVVKSMGVDLAGFALGVGAVIGVAALGLTFAPAVIVLGTAGAGIAGLGYVTKKALGVN